MIPTPLVNRPQELRVRVALVSQVQ
jgi:hypothetical protein